MRLVDSAQMQAMDLNTIEKVGIPGLVLMENAARSWVAATIHMLRRAKAIYIFCGAGNNGGDGYAIARIIKNQGLSCQVIVVKSPKSADCIKNADIWQHFGESREWASFAADTKQITSDDILIDAVLGTGIETPLRGDLPEILHAIDALPGRKLAVDLPSGISASSGDNLGAAIRADVTVTFQTEKIGHHLYPGKHYSGHTNCQKISILETVKDSDQPYHLVTQEMVREVLPIRDPESYKNMLGHCSLWCGSPGTVGAAVLASHASIKTGVGLVTSALPQTEQNVLLSRAPELMVYPQEKITTDWINQFNALVIGCGLGRDSNKWDRIEEILKDVQCPVLFDADAFYGISSWDKYDLTRMVLTPHVGEFSKLSGFKKPETNRERIDQGLMFVKNLPTTLVLKGAPTIVFSVSGEVFINSTGNAGMATAGSGDVLAGMIGGWLAQGLSPINAAILGTWIHGKCGDLYSDEYNMLSLTASSLIDYIPTAVSELSDSQSAG